MKWFCKIIAVKLTNQMLFSTQRRGKTQKGPCHTDRYPSIVKEAWAVEKKCPPNIRLRKPAHLMEDVVSELWLM